jgi:WD40 repeat protein
MDMTQLDGPGPHKNDLYSYFRWARAVKKWQNGKASSSLLATSRQLTLPVIAANEQLVAIANVKYEGQDSPSGIYIFDLHSRLLKAVLQSEQPQIHNLALDGCTLVSSSQDKIVKIWDLANFSLKNTFHLQREVAHQIWFTAHRIIFKNWQCPSPDSPPERYAFKIYNRETHNLEKTWQIQGSLDYADIENDLLKVVYTVDLKPIIEADSSIIHPPHAISKKSCSLNLMSFEEKTDEPYPFHAFILNHKNFYALRTERAGEVIIYDDRNGSLGNEYKKIAFYKTPLTVFKKMDHQLILGSRKRTLKIFNLTTGQINELHCPDKQRLFSLVAVKNHLITVSYQIPSKRELREDTDWQDLSSKRAHDREIHHPFPAQAHLRPLPSTLSEVRIWKIPASEERLM